MNKVTRTMNKVTGTMNKVTKRSITGK
jgi:hypothetical protein